VINAHETMPAQFTHDADFTLPGRQMARAVAAAVRPDAMHAVDAGAMATALLGDSIAANLFTLGYAYQKGLVPVGAAAIETAVRLNGAAVEMNLKAFAWGRRAAVDEAAVRAAIPALATTPGSASGLDEIVARRVAFLTDYQNASYAKSYADFVAMVRAAEARLGVAEPKLAEAVARGLFKLMSYKDEYEVARLHADPSFHQAIATKFSGGYRLTFHLAPPILGRRDPTTGRPLKSSFGPWMMTVFRILARLKGLRGSAFDLFGRSAERRTERALISIYRTAIEGLLADLDRHNHATAVEIAALPERIRGFGHIKEAAIAAARHRQEELVERFRREGAKRQEPLAAE